MDIPTTNQYATEYEKISTKEEYIKNFKGTKLEEAFKYVLDIRKFEIELYWKRATYFWTFIGAILAAHFVLRTTHTTYNAILERQITFNSSDCSGKRPHFFCGSCNEKHGHEKNYLRCQSGWVMKEI